METINQRHERQAVADVAIRNWDGREWLAKTMLGHHTPLIRPVKVKPMNYVYEVKYVVDTKGKARGVPYVNVDKRAKRAMNKH